MIFNFIVFVAICVGIYFLVQRILQFLILRAISKSLKAKVEPINHVGLFSFDSLTITNECLSIVADRVKVSLHPFHVLTGRSHFVSADIRKLDVIVKPGIEKLFPKKESKKILNIEQKYVMQLLIHAIIYSIRSFDITIVENHIKFDDLAEVNNKGIRIGLNRKKLIFFSLDIGETEINLKDQKFAIKPFTFGFEVSLDFIGHYINQYIFVICSEISLNDIGATLSKNTISIAAIGANAKGYPGEYKITSSPLTIEIPFTLPDVYLTIKRIALRAAFPLRATPNCTFKNIDVELEELNVKSVTEKFVNINQAHLEIQDIFNFSFKGSIDKVLLDYSTLDGLQVFQIVHMLRPKVYKPTRITFAFPEGDATINSIEINVRFTDKAIIHATTEKVAYKDKGVVMPKLIVCGNGEPFITATNLGICSPDKEYLTVTADKFTLKNRNKISIADLIDQCVMGWKIVKPIASANVYDSETVPFPIRLIIKKIGIKTLASLPYSHLTQVQKILPKQLRDNIVLDHIFSIKSRCLTEEQVKQAEEQLPYLKFENYKNAIRSVEFPKYLMKIIMEKLDLKLDSRNFQGKEEKLKEYDEATAQNYPDIKWETLEGFKIDAFLGNVECYSLDLPKPYLKGHNISVKGGFIIAENNDGNKVDAPCTVFGQEFIIKATGTDTKMYCDMQANISLFQLKNGGQMIKIFDDFSDCISQLIPEKPDTSPRLMWWDKMRSVMRGKYNFSFNTFRLDWMGPGSYYNQDDFLTMRAINGLFSYMNDHIVFKGGSFDLIRNENGVIVGHLPNFTYDIGLIYDTPNGNQKLHITECCPSRWGDPEYDMYKDFRATGVTFDILMTFHKDNTDPYFAVDIPHFFWIIQPMTLFSTWSPLFEGYKKKYHIKQLKRKPTINSFGKLRRTFDIKMKDIDSLSFRVYDQFPVPEEDVRGSSLESALINANINVVMKFSTTEESRYEVQLKTGQMNMNAAEIPSYDKYATSKVITFMSVYDLDVNYGDSTVVSVSDIKVYMNYVFLNYIHAFIFTAKYFVNKAEEGPKEPKSMDRMKVNRSTYYDERNKTNLSNNSDLLDHLLRKKSSQRTVSVNSAQRTISEKFDFLQRFRQEVISIQIPKVQIIAQSLEYNVSLLIYLEEVKFRWLKDSARNLYGSFFKINSVYIKDKTGFDPEIKDIQNSLFMINDIIVKHHQEGTPEFHDNEIEASIELISCNETGSDISTMQQIIKEMTVQEQEPKSKNDPRKKFIEQEQETYNNYIAITIPKITVVLYVGVEKQTPVMICSMFDFDVDCQYTSDNSIDSMISVKDIVLNDMRTNSTSPRVLERWVDKINNKEQPLIRFILKRKPPVGGITVYSHLEFNVLPMVVEYETDFFDLIFQSFLHQAPLKPFEKIAEELLIKNEIEVKFKPLAVSPGVLPALEKKSKQIVNELNQTDVSVMIQRSTDTFLVRYLKITQAGLNVSYTNLNNPIIPNIHEFNAVLHDITVQDLTTSFSDLVFKLAAEISKDIIPQFLKHSIGIGKVQPNSEKELKKWLGSSSNPNLLKTEQTNDTKKELLFGSVKGRK